MVSLYMENDESVKIEDSPEQQLHLIDLIFFGVEESDPPS